MVTMILIKCPKAAMEENRIENCDRYQMPTNHCNVKWFTFGKCDYYGKGFLRYGFRILCINSKGCNRSHA